MSQRDFILDWERALGFKGDPFADRIIEPAGKLIVNRVEEKEKLNWFFIKGFFYGSIIGEHGVGKTMLLKWLEDRLNKYNKVHCVYINAAVFRDQINIPQQIVEPILTVYERHISKPHQKINNFDHVSFLKKKIGSKSIALLIDNAHNITDRNIDVIRSLREEGLRIQVIAATTQNEYEKSRLLEFGNDELNVNLRRLTFEESKEMLRRRTEAMGGTGVGPFQEETLQTLYDKADKNPRQFIHLCRDEAIRILIQKKGHTDRVALKSQPVSIPPAPKETVKPHIAPQTHVRPQTHTYTNQAPQKQPVQPNHDIEQPKSISTKRPTSQEMRSGKKMFNVSFNFGKSDNVKMPSKIKETEKIDFFEEDDASAVTNDRYKQDLVNKLSSSSSTKKKTSKVSDTDKLLRDLNEEFGDE